MLQYTQRRGPASILYKEVITLKLTIGENIKRLRRERDMTQEELAELLGVSFQSVSRWEKGACYPDLELIPAIAGFFGVSSDRLMGLDEAREADEIAAVLDQFQQAISIGDIDACISIARAGLKAHPGSYALMNKLMYALFVAGDETGNIPNWKENMEKYDAEITQLGERIIKYCPDQSIRLEATARLAFNHCEMGRKQQGRALYETLPDMEYTREGQIWWALDDAQRAENALDLIRKSQSHLGAGVWQLINSHALSDSEQEEAARQLFAIRDILYGEDAPHQNGQLRSRFARILARQGKNAEALEQLHLAAQQALAFDARPDEGEYVSLLLGRRAWKRSDYETADTRTAAEILRDRFMAHADFDAIRESDGFQSIVHMLTPQA